MKIHLLIFGVFSICTINIFAQTEWNREVQIDRRPEESAQTRVILNLSGIGAVINKENGKCVIKKLFEGSGAAVAGLKEADVIKYIDSKDVYSLDLKEIAALLRGDPGTKVVLTIQRVGEMKTQDFVVVRQPVKLQ